ncbi:MAG: polyprenol monophosphomannose synthase [Planctomycetota bacterium]
MTASGLCVVPDYPAAEDRIRGGIDSQAIVVLAGQEREAAEQAASAGLRAGRGPLRAAPFDCGRRCLVVMPTYNERDNLERVVADILAYLATDVLVVDDGSPDGTGAIADRIAAGDPRVAVLHRQGKQGLGTAYIAGFRHAIAHGYDLVFEMDADFSHPPWDLPRLAAAARDAELVIGSRYVTGGSTVGWDFKRRMLSRGANFYARTVLGMATRDITAGFRCYQVAALARLDLEAVAAHGYAFQIEMAFRMARAGFRVLEVPIHFTDRRVGQSKMDGKIAREALLLVPGLRRRVPRLRRG